MRAVRRSPLLRIALLGLAVLLARTGQAANTLPIAPLAPPCPVKVAAAQPDTHKRLPPGNKQIVRFERLADHHLFGGSFGFTAADPTGLAFTYRAVPIALARRAIDVAPQHRPFALRI